MDEILLKVDDLRAGIEGKEILRGINLTVRPGEVHAIMGPNGSGKSTLSGVLAGNPRFTVTGGSADFHGLDLLALSPEDRSHEATAIKIRAGIAASFQNPIFFPDALAAGGAAGVLFWVFLGSTGASAESRVPHVLQKLAVGLFSVPHLGHLHISAPPLLSPVRRERNMLRPERLSHFRAYSPRPYHLLETLTSKVSRSSLLL